MRKWIYSVNIVLYGTSFNCCCHLRFSFFFLYLFFSAKQLKTFSSSRKSSPSRTPVKKQTKVQSLLDPSRLKPPPTQVSSTSNMGNLLSANSRINYGLGIQSQRESLTTNGQQSNEQEQSPPRNIILHLDANEIITVAPDSSVI